MSLFWSLCALFAGPLLLPLLRRQPALVAALDGAVVVSILGLVGLHVLPHSIAARGWPALALALLGSLLPSLMHGPNEHCQPGRGGGRLLLLLAVLALGLHAILDGLAVGLAPDSSEPLALAVILHRVSEGLGIWWLLGSQSPRHWRLAALLGMAGLTLLGSYGGHIVDLAGPSLELLQAGMAGSLLHVLMRHAAPPGLRAAGWPSAAGALAGGALLAFLDLGEAAHGHPHALVADHGPVAMRALASQVAPWQLAALALTGLAHALAPQLGPWTRRPGGAWRLALTGAMAGLSTAICSCGVLPLYRLARRRGGQDAASWAFLMAAPTYGLAPLLLTWSLWGPWLALWQGLATLVLATLLGRLLGPPGAPLAPPGVLAQRLAGDWLPSSLTTGPVVACQPSTAGLAARLQDGWHYACGEVLDHAAPWLLAGLAVAALLETSFEPAWLRPLAATGGDVPLLLLCAAPFYISSSAATLVATVLHAQGASLSACLGFMLVGPATSLTTAAFLNHEQGRKRGWIYSAWVLLGALLSSLLGGRLLPLAAPPLASLSASAPMAAWPQLLLAALLVASLWRQGLRPFLGRIALPNTQGRHSHHHEHSPTDLSPIVAAAPGRG